MCLASVIECGVPEESVTLSDVNLPYSCNVTTHSVINVECIILNGSHSSILHNLTLPENTTGVSIYVDSYIVQIPDTPFHDLTWNPVLHLKLCGNGNIGIWRLSKRTFHFVKHVQFLHLRDAGIKELEHGTFSELPDLIVLDLSQNRGLHLIDLTNAMVGLSSPNLQVFNVSGVNSLEDMSLFTVERQFMENLRNTRLTVLDISWTRIIAFATPLRYYLSYLECFNASGTTLLGQSSCLSDLYYMESLKYLVLDKWPVFTRSSSLKRPITNECIYANSSTNGECFNSPPNLELFSFIDSTINISYIFERNGKICINPNNKIKRMNLSGVKWTLSKVFSPITGLQYLEDFDISRTSLTAIRENSFHYFPALKILNMDGNSFSEVALSTFSALFTLNGNLSHLKMSWNNINILPFDFLLLNQQIAVLDLSHNSLKSFRLEFHKEAHLEFIDLSFNMLLTINPVFGDFISRAPSNSSYYDGLVIDTTGNDFQCNCSNESLELIRWMDFSQSNKNIRLIPPNVTCKYDNSIAKVSNEILAELKKYCISDSFNHTLYAVIGIFVAACVGLFIMFGIWYCRRRSVVNGKENYMQQNVGVNIVPDKTPDYAVFLSFSSKDQDFVIDVVWPKLESKLKHSLRMGNKIVFVGDANFDLGKQICEEVICAASRCWCTVLIISNSFLESDWCLFEVQSSWNSGCRIFPLFIEKCDGSKAKGIMKVVCRDMVRLLWPKDRADLQEQLFDSLCSQIVQHIKLHDQSG
ncbi:hypothetical protein ACJMK2_026077 [Sinanodonta woodiana]|uniref:TIR domain-containing protein n=1 Tax=Sinanodonta woodiana TaxID=1069815 RepID=A0ABD3XIG7_SINWO